MCVDEELLVELIIRMTVRYLDRQKKELWTGIHFCIWVLECDAWVLILSENYFVY